MDHPKGKARTRGAGMGSLTASVPTYQPRVRPSGQQSCPPALATSWRGVWLDNLHDPQQLSKRDLPAPRRCGGGRFRRPATTEPSAIRSGLAALIRVGADAVLAEGGNLAAVRVASAGVAHGAGFARSWGRTTLLVFEQHRVAGGLDWQSQSWLPGMQSGSEREQARRALPSHADRSMTFVHPLRLCLITGLSGIRCTRQRRTG
jgi:hypothetical protein